MGRGSRKTKIAELEPSTLAIVEKIARFDVSVNDGMPVTKFQGIQELERQRLGPGNGKGR
eukprot:CAMPEP_0168231962 /NCGR_PEP_ID=MMETSP0140_2-20121125/16878_1 /TAXON_ID=44445 /ORGANISM="Pseudo-nitzschia australis, Strain 10249 10 AB" /LENGTH=59 /DNA_ID=CAMNT_0008164455 /DNA_START=491 /DNA_END=667 /DNA_ORIENTATION=-